MYDLMKPDDDEYEDDDGQRSGPVKFVLLWIIAHFVASMLFMFLTAGLFSGPTTTGSFLSAVRSAIVGVIPAAIVQVFLVERCLKQRMRGWLLISLIGLILTGLVLLIWTIPAMWRVQSSLPEMLRIRLDIVLRSVPLTVIQWFWLRRRVKSAWLWILAALVGAILSTLAVDLAYSDEDSIIPFLLAYTLYYIVPGITMYFLWTHPRDAEKVKYGALSDAP